MRQLGAVSDFLPTIATHRPWSGGLADRNFVLSNDLLVGKVPQLMDPYLLPHVHFPLSAKSF
jgi:hypothetical protein